MMLLKVPLLLLALPNCGLSAPGLDNTLPSHVPEYQDLSFVDSIVDFVSHSDHFALDPQPVIEVTEEYENKEKESSSDTVPVEYDDVSNASEQNSPPPEKASLEEQAKPPTEGDVGDTMNTNETFRGSNLRVETGLFFDVAKGNKDDDCDDSESDSDSDCDDDDDDERSLLKKILFFLPASYQAPAAKRSQADPTIYFTTNTESVEQRTLSNTSRHPLPQDIGNINITSQFVPTLDGYYESMESTANRGRISLLSLAACLALL